MKRIPTLHFQQIPELFLQTQYQLSINEDKIKGTARFAQFDTKLFGLHFSLQGNTPVRFNWVYEGMNTFLVGIFDWDETAQKLQVNSIVWDGSCDPELQLASVYPNLQIDFEANTSRRLLILFLSVYALDDHWSLGRFDDVVHSLPCQTKLKNLFSNPSFEPDVTSLLRLLGPDFFVPQEVLSKYLGACFDVSQRIWKQDYATNIDPQIHSIQPMLDLICRIKWYDKPLTSNEYAQKMGLNLRQLNQFCQQHHQVSFQDYFHRTRFEQAKIWLEQDRVTVAEVARRLHFKNPFYFTKKFEEYMGFVPKTLRKQTKQHQTNLTEYAH